jgi:hypothetical protein
MAEPSSSEQYSEKPLPAPPGADPKADGAFSENPLPAPAPPEAEPSPEEERAAARRAAEGRIAALRQSGLRGANWFFWVAGLSIVNSLVAHGGGDRYFVVGLGVTLVVDGIAKAVGEQHANLQSGVTAFAIGFAVTVAIAVSVVGLLSRKGYLIPFAIAMVCYLFDGLIFLMFGDFLSVAFHAYALVCMWAGFSAFRQIKAIEADMPAADPLNIAKGIAE